MKKREWVAGKPKKKPDYDSGQITGEVLSVAEGCYSVSVDKERN